jgi:hypothetical protein
MLLYKFDWNIEINHFIPIDIYSMKQYYFDNSFL